MDLNDLLIWTVAAGCGVTLLQLLEQKAPIGRIMTPLGILGVLSVFFFLKPEVAGFVSGALFVLLMLVPAGANTLLSVLLARKRYVAARSVAMLLAVLQPFGESRRLPRLIQALGLLHRGKIETAVAILESSFSPNSPMGRMAMVIRVRHQGNWQEILDWKQSRPANERMLTDPLVLDAYLQALGETGHRDEMFRQFEQVESRGRALPATVLNMIRVKAAAFSGDHLLVKQLFSGPLRGLSSEVKSFWSATAKQVSGRADEATRDFQSLVNCGQAPHAAAAQRRIDHPLPTLESAPVTEHQQQVLRSVADVVTFEIRHDLLHVPRSEPCWGTWTLAAILVVVFLCEIPGGTESFENLERMGAMIIPTELIGHQWWRMLTAGFLHFGPWHLMMNLLGLLILGRRLEVVWGTPLILLTYLTATIGSIGLAPYFIDTSNEMARTVLVGASGGVMGLIGGLLIQAAIDLLRGRNRVALREFSLLLLVVIVQIIFDANTPNVSSEAHLLGMSIGILSGLLWNFVWWLKRPSHSRS